MGCDNNQQPIGFRRDAPTDPLSPMKKRWLSYLILGAGAVLATPSAVAGCGSAFCTLNTTWDVQDLSRGSGSTVLDLRYEFIRQDRLRTGHRTITRDKATALDDEAAEQYTYNRNLVATIDHTFSSRWGVTAQLPLIDRSHAHVSDPSGTAQYESWQFRAPGDLRVIGRYRLSGSERAGSAVALQFGLKFPTGDYRVANADGVIAERMLQPGSGSTDLIVGAIWSTQHPGSKTSLFAQVGLQHAVVIRDDYRPGDLYTLNVGARYALTQRVSALFQFNTLARNRESGANAENRLSGGLTLLASPGVAIAITRDIQAYGFVQLPLYRYVNGVQLTADWALVGGASVRF